MSPEIASAIIGSGSTFLIFYIKSSLSKGNGNGYVKWKDLVGHCNKNYDRIEKKIDSLHEKIEALVDQD